ncbi:hypothetical protein [Reinekea blandensis]|uniref:Uncharacterized protein n=1 Tax=Reinekea blandensis MED297 TaxID=314283 RepID=A4BDU0_9GAMM|nr:hypothetical protein [Reinekea blandensis]EAR09699.1 hypothetical protein MED297_16109 [Reinekea blandensis MED297]
MTQNLTHIDYAKLIGHEVRFSTDKRLGPDTNLFEWQKGQLAYLDGVCRSGHSFTVLFETVDQSELITIAIDDVRKHVEFVCEPVLTLAH